MALNAIELRNFRSYKKDRFEFSPKLNLIIGPNGAGKTNLLEAIYVLANTRSWREPDRNLLKHQQASLELKGQLSTKTISLRYGATPMVSKKLLINSTVVSTRDYLGHLRVVLFEPNSLGIITGGPDWRRQWLDQALSTHDPGYLMALLRYKRIIRQRNSLLKAGRTQAAAQLRSQVFAWDVGLVDLAALITAQRLDFLKAVDNQIESGYRLLAADRSSIRLGYRPKHLATDDLKNYATRLLDKLQRGLGDDLRYGFTTVGPHRDDVDIRFKNQPASQVASRGETRTIALALKLAEYHWLNQTPKTKSPPVLLFDDIFSELDQNRRANTLAQLKGAQIFITTTDLKGLSKQIKTGSKTVKL